jgi:hypothetical protein
VAGVKPGGRLENSHAERPPRPGVIDATTLALTAPPFTSPEIVVRAVISLGMMLTSSVCEGLVTQLTIAKLNPSS